MAIRPILTAPDPRLRQVSKPVERVDDALRALMDDMLETMYDAPGIGLAAIQIGEPLRVIAWRSTGQVEATEVLVSADVSSSSEAADVVRDWRLPPGVILDDQIGEGTAGVAGEPHPHTSLLLFGPDLCEAI